MDDNDYDRLESAQRNKPILAIVLTLIEHCHRKIVKHAWSIGEVNAMLTQIGLAFRLIPFVLHAYSVITKSRYVKRPVRP